MFEGFQKSRNLLVSLHKAHKLIFSYLAIPFIWDPLYRDLFPTHLDLVLWNRKKMYLSECLFFNPCFSLTFHQMTRTYYSIQDIFFYSLFYGVSHFCDFQLDLRKQHIVKWEQLRLLSLAQIHSLSLSSRSSSCLTLNIENNRNVFNGNKMETWQSSLDLDPSKSLLCFKIETVSVF